MPSITIEAYASKISVSPGETIDFHVWTSLQSEFEIKIYRKGYPQDTLKHAGSENAQPYATNPAPWENGCGWPSGYQLIIPQNWQSGVYFANLIATDPQDEAIQATTDVLFIVKAAQPGVNGKILFKSSVNTAQAYNNWGGKSLYSYNSTNQEAAVKVSFDRPTAPSDFLRWEYPFIQWMEKNGYTAEYCTDVDLHGDPNLLNNYHLLLSVGHDEYWTWEMRDHVDNFVENLGKNVAFFSGNVCWWQVRLEANNRRLVCYRNAALDPEPDPQLKTINWRNPPVNRPENWMTGVSFYNGAFHPPIQPDIGFVISLEKHWLLRNTGLTHDDEFGVYDDSQGHYSVVGYETDAADYTDLNKRFPLPTGSDGSPKDFAILARANVTGWGRSGSSGPDGHSGWATMGIFRKPPPAGFTFTAATTDWPRGLLTEVHGGSMNEVGKITQNVLDILGSSALPPQAFLLANPGFEQWHNGSPASWQKEGNGAISRSTVKHSGQYSLLVNASDGQTWVSQNYLPCASGRTYRVKCWVKADLQAGEDEPPVTIRLQEMNTWEEFAIAEYGNWHFWQEISAEGSFSANPNREGLVQVRVKIQVAAGYAAYFDDITVEEIL